MLASQGAQAPPPVWVPASAGPPLRTVRGRASGRGSLHRAEWLPGTRQAWGGAAIRAAGVMQRSPRLGDIGRGLAQEWSVTQGGCPPPPEPSVLPAHRPPGSSYFRYAESSMKNSFGLKYLHKFFNIPFLQLQVSPPHKAGEGQSLPRRCRPGGGGAPAQRVAWAAAARRAHRARAAGPGVPAPIPLHPLCR